MKKPKILVSFSAGETSAFMAQWLKKNRQDAELVFIFANTGQENEETLVFADKCDKKFKLNLIWVEPVIHHEKKIGTTHKIVNFQTAQRKGEAFEQMIIKYGIPNLNFPHCNRELKLRPIKSYARSIGWMNGDYKIAIGIRNDEIDRISNKYKENNIFYPLVSDIEMTKPKINFWWKQQPFRLELKGYEGNCKWCWKKSLRKLLTLAKESPEVFIFPKKMEKLYGFQNKRNNEFKDKINFFRNNLSSDDILIMSKEPFQLATDDSVNYAIQETLFDIPLDSSNGCEESCEIF